MKLKYNMLLLLAAAIWGFAFVAQRVGMEHVGPFTFNGIRFALGSLSLLPLMFFFKEDSKEIDRCESPKCVKSSLKVGILAGTILFIAASLQQIGLIYTTAGKAAFITCLYIVLVPMVGIFLNQRIPGSTWIGSVLAVIGLYFLCVKESLTISYGDLLELVGAFFWTAHILVIDKFSKQIDTLKLAFFQFVTCAIFSLATALIFESLVINDILQAGIPILYGGICSVGIAYTLQIVGQKKASPSHAAIILSMETVFAAIGGWLIINEYLGAREIFGCILMMVGMLVSQLCSLKPDQKSETKMSELV
ncbi:DMT family transporter [Dendrosporobacter sp. 1207_IL3150]|uniref:DMT family transporter n=1 Tax=Dendrosporobacter sp. 1207_IL3150 TaxID=3084054 RepID=UPI002FDA7DAC